MRAIIVVALVIVVLIGLLFTLRATRNSGMPGRDVLERAARRAREQARRDQE